MLAPLFRAVLRVAAVAVVATASQATAGGRVTVKVPPLQVGPHSYYVRGQASEASRGNQGFMSNAGFVVTPAGVVVFDTLGTPALGEELLRQIRKITKQPIKRVILSHFHADHSYGLRAFKAAGAVTAMTRPRRRGRRNRSSVLVRVGHRRATRRSAGTRSGRTRAASRPR